MTQPGRAAHHAPRHHRHNAVFDALFAIAMAFRAGSVARFVAGLAELTPDDRVLDIGCGPGAAARIAARRCVTATGVDPTPAMLRMGRWINAVRGARNVSLVGGSAEHIPLPDRSASVIWALRSVHHWNDRAAGLAEALRVLSPGGRLLLVEQLVEPGAHGGMTSDDVDQLMRDVDATGFIDVRRETRVRGRKPFNVIRASRKLAD
ncbi:MAG: class I SAM-dependent methyltransferase [Candidatus Dormibacteria bacterium]